MDRTGAYDMINQYTETLKKSSMTQKVNKLHKMCLIPFLKDILAFDGRLRKHVTEKDKIFWGKFLSCCFAGLRFDNGQTTQNIHIYIGSATVDNLDENTILNNSLIYAVSQSSNLISNRVLGTRFWIALPAGYALDKAENLDFAGDYIPASGFTRTNMVINNGQYTVYALKSRIPFKSTYKIILK